jgi:hypothetical protein
VPPARIYLEPQAAIRLGRGRQITHADHSMIKSMDIHRPTTCEKMRCKSERVRQTRAAVRLTRRVPYQAKRLSAARYLFFFRISVSTFGGDIGSSRIRTPTAL